MRLIPARADRPRSDQHFPKRMHGRVRIFCCPLRVYGNGRFACAVMATTPRFVPPNSLARKGRFFFNSYWTNHA